MGEGVIFQEGLVTPHVHPSRYGPVCLLLGNFEKLEKTQVKIKGL